ncbi:glucose-1-phosphate cytidylyltransferase [Clostridia bacterium]|nr:glucose-1-phosphate cytidylyltransferase [Clostridia bacterium]
MKVVILAGGYGTRISEESHLKPKPMVEIGSAPIIWHIMKYYSAYGFNEFIICCGYKGYILKEFFAAYYLHRSDVTFDFSANNKVLIHNNVAEPWRVTLVDTGLNTMTGGRIKRVQKYVGNEKFMMTYGDGVSNINLDDLLRCHIAHGKKATLTAIQPAGRFGTLELSDNKSVKAFAEKREQDGGWINGGFMVLEPSIFDYICSDETMFEREPLEKLSYEGELQAYQHNGFWQCMDTMRDKMYLDELLEKKKAPWVIWE